MKTKAHINITLDAQTLAWLDMHRGQEPRSRFLNYILTTLRAKSDSIFDWELESKKSEEDIQKGRVHKFKDAKKAIKWLEN